MVEKFEWMPKHEENIQELKKRLTIAPMLTSPNGNGNL